MAVVDNTCRDIVCSRKELTSHLAELGPLVGVSPWRFFIGHRPLLLLALFVLVRLKRSEDPRGKPFVDMLQP
jgi:hypothetical protein